MKIFLSISIFSFLFIANISAQKIKFGIVAGPASTTSNKGNLTLATTDSTKDHSIKTKSNFSFFGGIVASIPLSKTIVFRPQLEYIAKGWTNDVKYTNSPDKNFQTKLTSHWIELPLNFVYTVPAKNGRFLFGLGPYIAFALSAKTTDSREGFPDLTIEFTKSEVGNADGLSANRLDVGANLIASYEFRQGFFINLNYSHGFIDFRNDLDPTKSTSNKNIVVGLGLGYMFK